MWSSPGNGDWPGAITTMYSRRWPPTRTEPATVCCRMGRKAVEKYAASGRGASQRPVPARGKHFRGFLLCDGQAAHRGLHPRGIRRDLAGVHLLPVHDDAGSVQLEQLLPIRKPETQEPLPVAVRVRAGARRNAEGASCPIFWPGGCTAPCAIPLPARWPSRRNAMDSATKNAGEMIDDLQAAATTAPVRAAITQEITEIVAGAEVVTASRKEIHLL